MSSALRAAAVLLFACPAGAQAQQSTLAPSYSTASIVNAATNQPGSYAPNSIVSVYGTNLAYGTVAMGPTQGTLPTKLGGVTAYINNQPANLFFVSPTQINLLIPSSFKPSAKTLTIVREGTSGPSVNLPLVAAAPGFFALDATHLLANHADGSGITPDSPARPGEIVVIFAVGLGPTVPDFPDGAIPDRAAPIASPGTLGLGINGSLVDQKTILYAGVTPGCAGLYQINLQLPDTLPPDPEIRIGIGPQVSPPGTLLPVRQTQVQ